MNQTNWVRRIAWIGMVASSLAVFSREAGAHMPWLATDDQGHVLLWFGESLGDRTYHMPGPIAAIELKSTGMDDLIVHSAIDRDDLVGLRSKEPVDRSEEIYGSVTYGLYHGTKLTYHVEHLPHLSRSDWPTDTQQDRAYQTIVTASPVGGVSVVVLGDGKPMQGVEVKLFSEDGEEQANVTTDIAGLVTFPQEVVQPGLNALLVSITSAEDKGQYNGEDYSSTTDVLTATFHQPGSGKAADDVKKDRKVPKVDPESGVSIVPSGLPNLPEELTSFGAAIVGEKIFVYGGHTGDAHSYSTDEQSNRFWCLDVSAGEGPSWKELPSGPSLQGLALVAHNNRLIRIGGFTAMNESGEDQVLCSQDGVASFDLQTSLWTDLPSLPESRSSLDAAVLDDTLYLFGGWCLSGNSDDSQWHETAWKLRLDDANAKWQPIASPPFKRRAVSVAAHQGKLFVIGGMNSDGKPTTSVEVYDPKSNAWTIGPALPGRGMSGFGSSSFATGGNLYVSTMDGFLHQLGDDQQSWSTISKIDPARFFHRMLPMSDRELLMIGGANMEIGKFTQIDRVQLPACDER